MKKEQIVTLPTGEFFLRKDFSNVKFSAKHHSEILNKWYGDTVYVSILQYVDSIQGFKRGITYEIPFDNKAAAISFMDELKTELLQ